MELIWGAAAMALRNKVITGIFEIKQMIIDGMDDVDIEIEK